MIEILIPTYNRSQNLYSVLKTIEKALNSKKCQPYKKLYKIRIHEDKSENTASNSEISKILHNIPYEYKLFNYKQGIIKGILSLFKEAKSDYILLHSDDDFLDINFFAKAAEIIKLKNNNKICILARNIKRSRSPKEAAQMIEKSSFSKSKTVMQECNNFTTKLIFACRSHQLSSLVLPVESVKIYLKKKYINNNYHPSLGAAASAIFNLNSKPIFFNNHSVIVSKENIKSWSYNDDFFFFDIQQHFTEIFKGFKSIYASVIVFIFFNDKYLLKPFKFFKFISKKLPKFKIMLLISVAILIKLLKLLKIILNKFKNLII